MILGMNLLLFVLSCYVAVVALYVILGEAAHRFVNYLGDRHFSKEMTKKASGKHRRSKPLVVSLTHN